MVTSFANAMGAWLARSYAFVTVAGLLVATSCRQIVGIDSRSVDPGRCGAFKAPEGCSSCIEASCCTEARACRDDAACARAMDCFLGCAQHDAACQGACDSSSVFTNARADLLACEATRCEAACTLECGGRSLGTSSCHGCAAPCCPTASACAASVTCGRMRACEEACQGDVNCIDDCRSVAADSAAIRRELDACPARSCAAASGPWSCVGHLTSWPGAASGPFTVKRTYFDASSGKPIAGLRVRACASSDTDCRTPFAEVVTDAQGLAAIPLTLPGTQTAFHGYFELQGDVGGASYRVLHYVTPPLYASGEGTFYMPSVETVRSLEAAVGHPMDPSRGLALFTTQDCGHAFTGGVALAASTADAQSTAFYIFGGVPRTDLTETSAADAQGGFANLPPGLMTLTGTLTSLCTVMSRLDVLIRPGYTTMGPLPPTPLPN